MPWIHIHQGHLTFPKLVKEGNFCLSPMIEKWVSSVLWFSRLWWRCLVPATISKGPSMALHAKQCYDPSYFWYHHRCTGTTTTVLFSFEFPFLCSISSIYRSRTCCDGGIYCSYDMLLELRICLRGTSRVKNFLHKTTLWRRVNWQASTSETVRAAC